MKKRFAFIVMLATVTVQMTRLQETKFPVNENTPSKAIYFSWINHAWEGTDEQQTLANLKFFKWMHDEYGMKLDLYLIDAGNLDEGPECIGMTFGENRYGFMNSERFRTKFPNSLKPISDLAKSFNCDLGMWLGPDGYGTNPVEAQRRIETITSLCRDYNVKLV